MSGLEFLGVIATFAIVLIWYVKNAEVNADADLGWLAIAVDPRDVHAAKKKSYRVKERVARRRHEVRDLDGVRALGGQAAKPSYRVLDEESHRNRRAYRVMDEARYQKAGDGKRYNARKGPTAKYTRRPST